MINLIPYKVHESSQDIVKYGELESIVHKCYVRLSEISEVQINDLTFEVQNDVSGFRSIYSYVYAQDIPVSEIMSDFGEEIISNILLELGYCFLSGRRIENDAQTFFEGWWL